VHLGARPRGSDLAGRGVREGRGGQGPRAALRRQGRLRLLSEGRDRELEACAPHLFSFCFTAARHAGRLRAASRLLVKLARVRGNDWQGRSDDGIDFVVTGTEHAPDPELETTLRDLVGRWREVRQAIEAFAAALPDDAFVPLQPPLSGGFAASDCGFAGELHYLAVVVTHRDASSRSRAAVTFYTGLPDGYASFEVELEEGRPVSIEAFAS
jgi:hypothetical protein